MGCATTAPHRQPGRELDDILAANARWDSASVKRDPVLLADLMAEDFVHVGNTGNLGTKPTIIQSLKTNTGFGYAVHRTDSVTIKYFGNTAVMNGIVVRVGDTGRSQDDGVFRFTRVWVKTQTGWKVTGNQYTLIPGRK